MIYRMDDWGHLIKLIIDIFFLATFPLIHKIASQYCCVANEFFHFGIFKDDVLKTESQSNADQKQRMKSHLNMHLPNKNYNIFHES